MQAILSIEQLLCALKVRINHEPNRDAPIRFAGFVSSPIPTGLKRTPLILHVEVCLQVLESRIVYVTKVELSFLWFERKPHV